MHDLFHDLRRDWKKWNRTERFSAVIILATLTTVIPTAAIKLVQQNAAPSPLDRRASEAHSYERPFGSPKVRQSFSNFSLPRPEPNGQPIETSHLASANES